jgi:hypothetical protein
MNIPVAIPGLDLTQMAQETLWVDHKKMHLISLAISGTDWLEVPAIYKAYARAI